MSGKPHESWLQSQPVVNSQEALADEQVIGGDFKPKFRSYQKRLSEISQLLVCIQDQRGDPIHFNSNLMTLGPLRPYSFSWRTGRVTTLGCCTKAGGVLSFCLSCLGCKNIFLLMPCMPKNCIQTQGFALSPSNITKTGGLPLRTIIFNP